MGLSFAHSIASGCEELDFGASIVFDEGVPSASIVCLAGSCGGLIGCRLDVGSASAFVFFTTVDDVGSTDLLSDSS